MTAALTASVLEHTSALLDAAPPTATHAAAAEDAVTAGGSADSKPGLGLSQSAVDLPLALALALVPPPLPQPPPPPPLTPSGARARCWFTSSPVPPLPAEWQP